MRPIASFTAGCLLILHTTLASASELRPLTNILEEGNYVEHYVLERCSGLWMAVAKWGGEHQLGAARHEKTLNVSNQLLQMAIEMPTHKVGETLEEKYTYSLKVVKVIAQSYLDKFQSNYETTGSAWASDSDFVTDMKLCAALSTGTK